MLPVYPAPLAGEWVGSWVARLADANVITAPRLLNALGIDPVHPPGERDFHLLAEATGFPVADITGMHTPVDPLLSIGSDGNRRPPPVLGVRYVQVCPLCLAGDEVPFIRRDWVRRSVAACPTHGGPLRVTCPHCDKGIQVMRPHMSDVRLGSGLSRTRSTDLRHCWVCGGDLSHAPASDRRSVLPWPASRRLLHTDVPEEEWDRFVLALWTMINTLGVTDLMEPGQLPLRPVRRWMLSPHSPEARLQAQQLTAWWLGAQEDGFAVTHPRVRTSAAVVQGLLINLGVNSNRRWLSLSWLLTRLIEDSPRTLIASWPPLLECLVARLDGDLEPPPSPRRPLTLTDAQWQLVLEVLNRTPKRGDTQAVFTTLLSHAVYGGSLVDADGRQSQTLENQIEAWMHSGQVGFALELLYADFKRATHGSRTALIQRAFHASDQDWRNHTARVLLSDGMIELTRQVNRTLHRRLVTALVGTPRSPTLP